MPAIIYTMNKALVLAIDGEFNIDEVEKTRSLVDELIESHSDVLVDISTVSCIDAAGIGAMVYLYKQLQLTGCKLSMICEANSQPRHLFSILHIDRCITCFNSMEDYLAAYETDRDAKPRHSRISVAM